LEDLYGHNSNDTLDGGYDASNYDYIATACLMDDDGSEDPVSYRDFG
jgi:hypothetical protein